MASRQPGSTTTRSARCEPTSSGRFSSSRRSSRRPNDSVRPAKEAVMRTIAEPTSSVELSMDVNGEPVSATVPARMLLADFLRERLRLTGTHLGCEHGICGACTILLDGRPVRSCIMLAAQADGARITTVEGITPREGLGPLQQAFKDHHALQCGFCTAGILMTLTAAEPSE